MNNAIENDYYNWLCHFVRFDYDHEQVFQALYNKEFVYLLVMDGNRSEDGMSLRYRFCNENGIDINQENFSNELAPIFWRPCSVLEMMVALCLRCEESIMHNELYGDRTSFWFENMLDSLGLYFMTDKVFEPEVVDNILDRFLYRQYGSNGQGSLFTINNMNLDCRSLEIWTQMNWYLSNYS